MGRFQLQAVAHCEFHFVGCSVVNILCGLNHVSASPSLVWLAQEDVTLQCLPHGHGTAIKDGQYKEEGAF